MPTAEELADLANASRPSAVFWHAYFAAFIIALILGVRPSRRISGLFLALPFLSVSFLACLSVDPFNGILFGFIGILLISVKLPQDSVQFGRLWVMFPGIFMFVFGWIYPHFMDESSSLSFLYSAPVGVIPSPTLSIGIGLSLILNSLSSRKFSLILGISGIMYGIAGALQLGVSIDWYLLLGSIVIMVVAITPKLLNHSANRGRASFLARLGQSFSTYHPRGRGRRC